MFIAVFSDSHDNLPNLRQALEMVEERGIRRGFHLGDFCRPSSLELLAQSGLQWQCVWGNNDSELSEYEVAEESEVDLKRSDFRELEVEGRKIFLTHYPKIARIAALSGKYDACFFGHNHRHSQELIGRTLLANPGELLGWRFKEPSFGVYDTDSGTFRTVFLPK